MLLNKTSKPVAESEISQARSDCTAEMDDRASIPRLGDTARKDAASFLDYLAEKRLVGGDSLDRIRQASDSSGEPVTKVLTQLGFLAEDKLAFTLSAFMDIPLFESALIADLTLPAIPLSATYLRAHRAIPLGFSDAAINVGLVDPLDPSLIEDFEFAFGKPARCFVLQERDFERLFERHFGGGQIQSAGTNDAAAIALDDLERLQDSTSTAPIVRLVSTVIAQAVESGASDIHVEPGSDSVRIRYRIDGVLNEVDRQPSGLAAQIVSRIKILARLNISEKRLPQDGRIKLAVRGRDIDFRVSTAPAMHGESVVLRILDRSAVRLDLPSLGFSAPELVRFRSVMNRPHGIMLVTGPTGSGKTTTLYASLLELNSSERKLLTIEDPIEYQLAGINQVQVRPGIGLTFAHALRAFLRQDPDIMMVGEIRDLETAQIAVQAALTGHLILSTLHTNDAASAITRLLDMGLENYLLAATINGIVGQRLVRCLCPTCRESYKPDSHTLQQLGLSSLVGSLFRPRGCPDCHMTGYRGRQAITEILPITDAIHALIIDRPDAAAIRTAALSEGMQSMFATGRALVMDGRTSMDELLRVIRED